MPGPPVTRSPSRAAPTKRRGLVVPLASFCLAILAPFTLLSVVLWLMGWRLQPIETSSMAPAYPSGALAAVQPIDASQVEPGMVIVFVDPSGRGLIAHRVVARLPGEAPVFRTRGDHNAVDDPYPVFPEAVRGRVRWAVPNIGTVVSALDSWWGAALLIGGPATTLAVTEWQEARGRRRSGSQPSEKSERESTHA